jgi:hypothetical protein
MVGLLFTSYPRVFATVFLPLLIGTGELLAAGRLAGHGEQRAGTSGFDRLDVDLGVADEQVPPPLPLTR